MSISSTANCTGSNECMVLLCHLGCWANLTAPVPVPTEWQVPTEDCCSCDDEAQAGIGELGLLSLGTAGGVTAAPVLLLLCCMFDMMQVQQIPTMLPNRMRCSVGITKKFTSCAAGHNFQLASNAGTICRSMEAAHSTQWVHDKCVCVAVCCS